MAGKKSELTSIMVLHVGPFSPPIGGMSTLFGQLAKSHLDGYAFLVLKTNRIDKFIRSGWKRHCMNLINAVLLTGHFLKTLFCFRPRIVHIQTNSGAGFFEKASLLFWAKAARANTVIHIHGGGFRDFYSRSGGLVRAMIRYCLNRADVIIVLSQQMRSDFESIGVDCKKLAIVSNGVVVPELTAHRKTTGEGQNAPLTVLFLNRIDVPKGVDDLLAAAESVCRRSQHVAFRVVGPACGCHARIVKVLQEKGLEERIQLLGPVSGQQKIAQYMQADIYVLPSHLEAFPIGLLEAMACGLPCVATTVGGIPEIIEDGVNGLLIPPGNASGLSEALWKLIADPELRHRLGQNARETIQQRYTWEHTLKALKAVYDSVSTG